MKKFLLIFALLLPAAKAYAAPSVAPSPIDFGMEAVLSPCADLGADTLIFADVVAKVCTKLAAPTDSPCGAGGSCTYTSTQSVTLTDSYAGSTLYGCYTTDGSAPWYNGSTCGGTGTHYTGAFNITATTTIKYIFCATNYSCSTPETTTYTINTGAALVSVETWSCAGACASHTIGTGTCLVGSCTAMVAGNWFYLQCENLSGNCGGAFTSTPSDSNSNSDTANANLTNVESWNIPAITAITPTNGAGNAVITLSQWSNIPTGSDPLDSFSTGASNPTSTTWTTPPLSTTNANDLCIWSIGSTTQGSGALVNSPYTIIGPSQLVSQTLFAAYNNVSATGAQSASGNMNASNSYGLVRGICVKHN